MRKRLTATGVVGTLLVSLLALVPIRSAEAVPGGLLWFDDLGSDSMVFGPNEAIVIYLGIIGRQCDFLFNTADIYIVSGTPSGQLSDAGAGKNTVIGSWGGGIFDELIGVTAPSGALGPGTYSVVIDECQDGTYDPEVDQVFENAIRVEIPPGEVPPLDPSITALKAGARQQAGDWQNAQRYLQVVNFLSTYGGCLSGIPSCVGTVIAAQLEGAIRGPLDPATLAIKAAGDMSARWQGIADDPPDPNFQVLPNLVVPPPVESDAAEPIERAAVDLANAARVNDALLGMLLPELERYQGADAADDATWALAHAREIDGILAHLGVGLPAMASAVDDLESAVLVQPDGLDTIAANAEAVRSRVELTGLSSQERALAANLGASPTEIDQIEADLADLDFAVSEAEILDSFAALEGGTSGVAGELASLRAEVQGVIAVLDANVDVLSGLPVADPGGPYATTPGATVQLSAAASSDPDGTIVGHAWDLDGDGAYDDSTSPEPTTSFPLAGTVPVGLRVTDDDGRQDTAVGLVTVNPVGSPPVIVPTPSSPVLVVELGSTAPVSAAATDVDGGTPGITWTFDGVADGSGPDYTAGPFDSDDIGVHLLEAVAADPSTPRSHTWFVHVVAVDVDGDGWRANVDCDDGNFWIAPGRLEVEGNGIDDDCDVSTSDAVVNDAPLAIATSVSTPEDTVVAFPLLGSDPEQDALTFEVVTPPATGSLVVDPGGQASYTPAANATGTVTFTFRVFDGELTSSPATATVRVDPVEDDPVTSDVVATGLEDQAIGVVLVGTDPDGDPLSFEIVTPPTVGSLDGVAGNSVTYNGAPDAHGTVTFTYRATDGSSFSAPSTATVQVRPVNDAPTVNGFVSASTPEDTPIDVALDAVDIDGDDLTFQVVTAPTLGSITEPDESGFTYVPGAGVSGLDQMVVRYRDGATSVDATVQIQIDAVNDPPWADDLEVQGAEDTPLSLLLPAGDPDRDPIVLSITDAPDHGTIVNLSGRRATYRPGPEYAGTDTFSFQVTDPSAESASGTVTLTIDARNDSPVALDEAVATINNRPVTVDVLANDSDAEGDPLALLSVGPATAGSAFRETDGRLTYSPAHGFTGVANVPYVVADGLGGSSRATLTVLVTPGDVDSRTWTAMDDFVEGDAFNVEQAGPNRLRIVDDAQAFDRVWVAVSSKGTVVKFDADTGAVLGEYRTAPDGEGSDPSRTTVDLNGSVWVANRSNNSVTHIGLEENGQCVDRNGNGVIDTSSGLDDHLGWTNDGGVDSDGGVESALDECILHYTKVRSSGTRHVSVNADNDVWVSGTGGQYFDLIDGDTGEVIREEGPVGYGGYGGLIDPNGVIWSASPLLRWDTALPLEGPNGGNWTGYGESSYGLCLAPSGDVWSTEYGATIRKYSASSGTLIGSYGHGTGAAQGCAVDERGDVWVAGSLSGNTVDHLRDDGTYIGSVTVGSGPTGVSVDAEGRVWATNNNEGTVSRIDPNAGPVGADGITPVGAVDFTSGSLGGSVYNYSDMTGSTLSGAPLSGTWCGTVDGGTAGLEWAALGWHTEQPGDSDVVVRVSTSEDGSVFSGEEVAANGAPIDLPAGRYLRACALLTRSTMGATPVLEDLTAWTRWPGPPSATDDAVSTPEDTAVVVDLDAVSDPPGAALSFELLAPPLHGDADLVGGQVTYQPDENYHGTDSVLFRASGAGLNSNIAAVEFEVTPVNDSPVAAGQSVEVDFETPKQIDLLAVDVDGDDLSFHLDAPPAHGEVTGLPDGAVTYTPDPDHVGPDSFTFHADDGEATSNVATVSIEVGSTVPGPPIDVAAIGGDENARVTWEPPASDGGSAITGYEVRVVGSGTAIPVDPDPRVAIVGGLVNGIEYRFEVRAENANGFGPWSGASNAARPRPSCEIDAFIDVDDEHPFCPEIKWMADNDIARGFPDGTYRPVGQVTRGQMAAFVYRMAGAERGPDPVCSEKPFSDLAIDNPFCGEIDWLVDEGISTGFDDGTYRPELTLTRAQMAAFLYRLTGSPRGADPQCVTDEFVDVAQSHAFCGEIDWMVDSGVTGGFDDGTFRPGNPISRQSMAAFLFRYNILTGIVGS